MNSRLSFTVAGTNLKTITVYIFMRSGKLKYPKKAGKRLLKNNFSIKPKLIIVNYSRK